MFAIFQKEKIITICMLSFFGISILSRLLLGFLYQNMIKEADNMAATNNKLLKQCKLKFANCFQLNNGVSNIPVFVDKFLNRLSIGPLHFETMYHLSGQSMLLSVVCSGIGVCKSIIQGRMLGEILPFYIVSFLGLYLYFSVSTVMDIKGKKRVLKVNLIDYLENHLAARLDITDNDMEMLFGRSLYQRGNRGRKRNGRKTVELMPIGGRLSIAEGSVQEVEALQNDKVTEIIEPEPSSSELVEGIRREVRRVAGAEDTGASDIIFTKDQELELEELLKEFLG